MVVLTVLVLVLVVQLFARVVVLVVVEVVVTQSIKRGGGGTAVLHDNTGCFLFVAFFFCTLVLTVWPSYVRRLVPVNFFFTFKCV